MARPHFLGGNSFGQHFLDTQTISQNAYEIKTKKSNGYKLYGDLSLAKKTDPDFTRMTTRIQRHPNFVDIYDLVKLLS